MSTTAPLTGSPSDSLRRNDKASFNHKRRIKRAKKSPKHHTEKSSPSKPTSKSYKRGFEQCANDNPTQKETTNTDAPTKTSATLVCENGKSLSEVLLEMYQEIIDDDSLSAEDKEQAEYFVSRIKQKLQK